jgi:hypothetical protein
MYLIMVASPSLADGWRDAGSIGESAWSHPGSLTDTALLA